MHCLLKPIKKSNKKIFTTIQYLLNEISLAKGRAQNALVKTLYFEQQQKKKNGLEGIFNKKKNNNLMERGKNKKQPLTDQHYAISRERNKPLFII